MQHPKSNNTKSPSRANGNNESEKSKQPAKGVKATGPEGTFWDDTTISAPLGILIQKKEENQRNPPDNISNDNVFKSDYSDSNRAFKSPEKDDFYNVSNDFKSPLYNSPSTLSPFNKPIQKQQQKQGNLPDDIQTKMETAFDTDFSEVNVHQNSGTAKTLNAVAFTQGNEIHFKSGYDPFSENGQEVLGHELSHVVQQRAGEVPVTHFESGFAVNTQTGLEQRAETEGKKAANGQLVNNNTSTSISPKPTVQKKSEVIQMWRDVPGGQSFNVESTAGNTEDAWSVFMSAARGTEGRIANSAESELTAIYKPLIQSRLRGNFNSISINTHTTNGFNTHWTGSVRFLFGDEPTPVGGGGVGASTLSNSGASSNQVQGTDTNTTGTSGGATATSTPGEGGGAGGSLTAGGSGSTGSSVQITQGDTTTTGSQSVVRQQLNRFTTRIGIEVNITGEYDMGSSWTDWINPATYGAWAGDALTSRSGEATGDCGSVIFFLGAGIVP
ncbi:MAG: DUF4157 domain-containing protein [Chitinophagaceae bacterium]